MNLFLYKMFSKFLSKYCFIEFAQTTFNSNFDIHIIHFILLSKTNGNTEKMGQGTDLFGFSKIVTQQRTNFSYK